MPEPDDPEIRRVYAQYEKDKKAFNAKHGWQNDWKDDEDE